VGDDDFGRFLLTALEQGNVDISKVARLADTASGMSVGSGVVGLKRGEALVSLPALPVKLVSTHGAGDVFVGTLAAGLATGLSFSASVGAANHAAARHVSEMPQSPE
jgi:sugar/nucleoside kinase (ribokinase family)